MFLVGEGLVFLLFVCFVLFQFLFYLILFLISEIQKGYGSRWEGKGTEELGGVEGVRNRIHFMKKKNLFFTKEKKRNSDENTVRNVCEKWQAPSKDKRSRDGCGKENWQRFVMCDL